MNSSSAVGGNPDAVPRRPTPVHADESEDE